MVERSCPEHGGPLIRPLIERHGAPKRKNGRGSDSPWLKELVARKPEKLAAVALANKTARIAWKLMVSGEFYLSNYTEAA